MRWVALATIVLLTGCLDDASEPVPDWPDGPPIWQVGDWWTYEFLATPRSDLTDTFTVVVAGQNHTHYFVGMPADDWSDLAIIYHTPAIGEVRKSDLMWETHDTPLEWLRFPLAEGAAWSTHWWGAPDASVRVDHVDDDGAVVVIDARGNLMDYEYSAEARNLAAWPYRTGTAPEAPWMDLRLTGHGHGYPGAVEVPHDLDLVIYHGVTTGVMPTRLSTGIAGTPVMLPTESFTIADGFTRMTNAILLGPLVLDSGDELPPSAGMEVTRPDGSTVQGRIGPEDGPSIVLWHDEAPTGTWSYVADAASGYAVLESLAYRVVEYTPAA